MDTDTLSSGVIVRPRVEIEFVHETTHWLTEALTSIGQFLTFIKAAKGFDIVEAASLDQNFRTLLRSRLSDGISAANPIYGEWSKFETWPDKFADLNIFIEKILLDLRADALLCHGRVVTFTPPQRVSVLAHAMGRYSQWLNEFPLLNNNSYDQQALDKFVAKSTSSAYFMTEARYRGHTYTTTDIIEAVAVCAEVIWVARNNIEEIYLIDRLSQLRNSSYFAPIREILYGLGEITTPKTLVDNIQFIAIVLCASLNPPVPALEDCDFDELSWEHVFPPLRFLLFFQRLDQFTGKRNVPRPSGLAFDEKSKALQTLVYEMMDPPTRSFRMHVTENKDLDAFGGLPNGYELNDHGAWLSNGRLLTPYDFRIHNAFQLKMALYRKGIETLEETMFQEDLKSITRYCDPAATIRLQGMEEEDRVPITSQFLRDSEPLSWFLEFTGVQTAGFDLVFKPGAVEFGQFLNVFPDMDPDWTHEIGLRSKGRWYGLLGLS